MDFLRPSLFPNLPSPGDRLIAGNMAIDQSATRQITRQFEGQVQGQTGRQTDSQTDGQTDGQASNKMTLEEHSGFVGGTGGVERAVGPGNEEVVGRVIIVISD